MSGGGATDIEEEELDVTEAGAAPLLDKRVAVITGGTRGIGRAIAEAFASAGAAVVLGGRSPDKGQQALAEMGVGDRASFVQCDVRRQGDVNNLVDQAAKRYGSVDIMVNNAGGAKRLAPLVDLYDEDWDLVMKWNLYSTFWGTRAALRHMLPRNYGRIINISSVEGKHGKPAIPAYVTCKHALIGLTKAIARENGTLGITCNAICPGAIETDTMRELGPQAAAGAGITYQQFMDNYAQESAIKRLNTVEEVAAMASLLASEIGGGITGALINVDGGTAQW